MQHTQVCMLVSAISDGYQYVYDVYAYPYTAEGREQMSADAKLLRECGFIVETNYAVGGHADALETVRIAQMEG
jgi:hypothetical protein